MSKFAIRSVFAAVLAAVFAGSALHAQAEAISGQQLGGVFEITIAQASDIYVAWDASDQGEDIRSWAHYVCLAENALAGTDRYSAYKLGIPVGSALRFFALKPGTEILPFEKTCEYIQMGKIDSSNAFLDTLLVPNQNFRVKVVLAWSFTIFQSPTPIVTCKLWT